MQAEKQGQHAQVAVERMQDKHTKLMLNSSCICLAGNEVARHSHKHFRRSILQLGHKVLVKLVSVLVEQAGHQAGRHCLHICRGARR